MTPSLLDIAIAFTLWASIGGLGLAYAPSAFVAPLGRRSLLARIVAVLLAYVLAPLATGGLIRGRAPALAGRLAPWSVAPRSPG